MGLEDVDLGWRLRALGYRNFYVPQAVVYHIGGYSVKRSRCTSAVSRNLLALLAKNARGKAHRWFLPALLHYFYGALYATLRLNPCSLKLTIKDILAGLKLLRYGASKSIGVEKLLGYLLKPWRSYFTLQIAAGIMWNLSYKRRYRTFSEYFNSLLKQYVELSCAEDRSFS